jgi:hypothetical protein
MKTIVYLFTASILFLFTACDHEVEMNSIVNENGSIHKTILLKDASQNDMKVNYFNASEETGWKVTVVPQSPETNKNKMSLLFEQDFVSDEAFNEALNARADTLFRIEANFTKQFRWFYTYIHYSETYKAIDRLTHIDASQYFTEEDYHFINRLPAEGAPISMADSLYAEMLNKKILENYAMRGIFEDHMSFFLKKIDDYEMDPSWKDTLEVHKEYLFDYIIKRDDIDEDFMLTVTDTLKIPYPIERLKEDFEPELDRIEKDLNFMSWAADGIFTNRIEMPWKVTDTNADSISGNTLIWQPAKLKYMIQDYTMYVSTRKMNYWTVILSALLVLGGAFYIFRKKSS